MIFKLLNRGVMMWVALTVIFPFLAFVAVAIALAFFKAGIMGCILAAALALVLALIIGKTGQITGIEISSVD